MKVCSVGEGSEGEGGGGAGDGESVQWMGVVGGGCVTVCVGVFVRVGGSGGEGVYTDHQIVRAADHPADGQNT